MTKEMLRLLRTNTFHNALLVHTAYHPRKIAFHACHQCAHTRHLLEMIDAAVREMT